MNATPTFNPGDIVQPVNGGSIGRVTYPGASGFPGRIYVNFGRVDGVYIGTHHYDPAELALVEKGG